MLISYLFELLSEGVFDWHLWSTCPQSCGKRMIIVPHAETSHGDNILIFRGAAWLRAHPVRRGFRDGQGRPCPGPSLVAVRSQQRACSVGGCGPRPGCGEAAVSSGQRLGSEHQREPPRKLCSDSSRPSQLMTRSTRVASVPSTHTFLGAQET